MKKYILVVENDRSLPRTLKEWKKHFDEFSKTAVEEGFESAWKNFEEFKTALLVAAEEDL